MDLKCKLHVRKFPKIHQQSALAKIKFLFGVLKSCTMYLFTGIKDVSAFLLAEHSHQSISAFAISLSPSETHTVAVAFNKKSETFSLEPICKSLRLQTHIPPIGRTKQNILEAPQKFKKNVMKMEKMLWMVGLGVNRIPWSDTLQISLAPQAKPVFSLKAQGDLGWFRYEMALVV